MAQGKTRLAWSGPESVDPTSGKLNLSGIVINSAKDFTKNTSLHGFKYLVEENRTFVEKAFWFIAVVASASACCWLLGDVYSKRNETPIIVTFTSELTPIIKILFPAVTICSEIKIVGETFEELVSDDGHRSEKLKCGFEDIKNLVCENDTKSSCNATVDWKTGMFLLNKISPALEDIVSDCKFRDESLNCSSLFRKSVTDVGVCYTFNGLSKEHLYKDEVILRDSIKEDGVEAEMNGVNRQDNITIEEADLKGGKFERGVDESKTKRRSGGMDNVTENYPLGLAMLRLTSSAGPKSGLSLVLHFDDARYSRRCKMPINGFKALLHDLRDAPIIRNKYFLIPTGQVLMAGIKPSALTTHLNLRKYSPEKRNCYFGDERNLRYFRHYTQENCELECVTNFTLTRCGCAAMFMPSNETVPLCTSKSMECVENISDSVYNRRWTLTACKCLPTCYQIIYNVEYSQARFDNGNLAGNASTRNKKSTHLFVYFKDTHVFEKVRREIYSNTDILASCGGLLGLFLGFSVLSLVEPAYFLTLRIFSNIKTNQKI